MDTSTFSSLIPVH